MKTKKWLLVTITLWGLAVGDDLKAQVNAVCKNISVNLDATGNKTISGTDINNNSSSSCGTISNYAASPNTFSCSNSGSAVTVTLTVSNSCSQTSTCKAKVTILDTLPKVKLTKLPSLFCSSDFDITMAASPSGGNWTSNKLGTVSGSRFTPSTSPTGVPIKIIYTYTNSATGCIGKDSMLTQVEALPEVEILTPDLDTCRSYDLKTSMTLQVSARMANTSGLDWTPLNPGTSLNTRIGTNVVWRFSPSHDSSETFLLYVQTKTGNACPFVDDLLSVRVHPVPHVSIIADDTSDCSTQDVKFTTTFINKVNPSTCKYQWDFGDGNKGSTQNPSHWFNDDNTYLVTLKVTSEFGCDSTVDMSIVVFDVPNAEFLIDTGSSPRFRFINKTRMDTTLSSDIIKTFWDFGDPNTESDTSTAYSPEYEYSKTGLYDVMLVASSNNGCDDTLVKVLEVRPKIPLYLPNAFSPGRSPGLNQTFRAVGGDFEKFEMQIYDRLAVPLFETKNIEEGWDGTSDGRVCQQGTYVYVIKVTDANQKETVYTGVIHLIR